MKEGACSIAFAPNCCRQLPDRWMPKRAVNLALRGLHLFESLLPELERLIAITLLIPRLCFAQHVLHLR